MTRVRNEPQAPSLWLYHDTEVFGPDSQALENEEASGIVWWAIEADTRTEHCNRRWHLVPYKWDSYEVVLSYVFGLDVVCADVLPHQSGVFDEICEKRSVIVRRPLCKLVAALVGFWQQHRRYLS